MYHYDQSHWPVDPASVEHKAGSAKIELASVITAIITVGGLILYACALTPAAEALL